ncbi:FmdB family zinc ribbon protein [Rubinisphaera margarita]|uniref:FmdB family zinc ribbon protein n=1 Tax=Rubinisphaera margarita TaxID=2909586 RepID=UPI001EE7D05F|nr:zinc ribbon domain-containing protein [Rubinisphaera margarita]MCG6157926.1 zinc ribbon domain-containing protein [Rubinisphaera margarita]
MPTYDYICGACSHTWELFQSIKASPVRKCPECGKMKAKRQIGTGAGVIFKGSGFYQTDYRSDSYKKGAEAAKKSESTTSDSWTKSESKAESKPSSSESSKKSD